MSLPARTFGPLGALLLGALSLGALCSACGGRSEEGNARTGAPEGTHTDDEPREETEPPEAGTSSATGDAGVTTDDGAEAPTDQSEDASTRPDPGASDDASDTDPDDPAPNEPVTQPSLAPEDALKRCTAALSSAHSPESAVEALAATLWGSEPDEALLEAASGGALNDPSSLSAELERLLSDPRAAEHLGRFGSYLLQHRDGNPYAIDKDRSLFPEFDEDLAASMRRETQLFSQDLFADPNGSSRAFFSATYSFADARLAALYGVDLTAEGFQRIELPADERAGLFTQVQFLAMTSREDSVPPTSGFLLRGRLLCDDIALAPPSNLPPAPAGPAELTNRQRYEAHLSPPVCWACHQFGTALGFAFENYDALGRFRSEQAGRPVDPSAVVFGTDGTSREYPNAIEMLRAFSTDPTVTECLVRHWLTFSLGREPVEALTRTFANYVLAPDSNCGPGGAAGAPCSPEITIESLALEAAECARDPEGGVWMQPLAAALATFEPIFAGSIPCGQERCLVGFEWCSMTRETTSPPACVPYRAGETGCEIALANFSICDCGQAPNGGATVSCTLR